MAEKETVFSSKIKYGGIFSFKDFYRFCYEWIKEEIGIEMSESKYEEKIAGNSKNIVVQWSGDKKLTDYFGFGMKVDIKANGLENVEIVQDGVKIKTNKGSVEVSAKGELIRDHSDKFTMSGFNKFLRELYEKWVIAERIGEYEGKVAGACDNFLSQAKSYLDLEGKK